MTFIIGSRVKLKPEKAATWCQPLHRFAQDGRAATIIDIGKHEPLVGLLQVQFYVKRKGVKPVVEWFRSHHLETAP